MQDDMIYFRYSECNKYVFFIEITKLNNICIIMETLLTFINNIIWAIKGAVICLSYVYRIKCMLLLTALYNTN